MAQSAASVPGLREVWEAPRGLESWLGTVDHKTIGLRYIVTAFVFFLIGGLEASMLRLQLARPDNTFLGPEAYNQLFTMHGTTMIFFFATPIMFGFGNYLIPLMIGARDMAFPRLNAFSYWVFLFAGLFMYSSFFIGAAPDGGWFAYTPMTGPEFSPGINLDFWVLGLLFLGIASTVGAINFIVTIFKMRAPGMSLGRMPLFVWTILVTAFAVLFAVPSLNAANLLLELERMFGLHFFDPAGGGDPLLWQHLFWVFGHPDVYIIFLPAVGIVSEVVTTFSRRPMIGYAFVAMAGVITGIVGFGVWAHHMFATGISPLATSFFSAASLIIAIPAGIQIFAWLSTMITGRPVFKTPLLFIAGFIFIFVLGGLSGVMFPLVSFDRQVTDTYFLVAHFHYVLVGGMVFPLFAGFYYWFPKFTGKLLAEPLGVWNFWVMFVGFNLTFFPMHIAGLLGMPRRVYTYSSGLGLDTLNMLEAIGAGLLGVGVVLFLVNLLLSSYSGKSAGDNPWEASSLEWSTSSPPPPYNFRTLPLVPSRYPLWTDAVLAAEVQTAPDEPPTSADPTDPYRRETLGTALLTAEAETIVRVSRASTAPFWLALVIGLVFVGLLVHSLWLAAAGAILSFLFLLVWLWPSRDERNNVERAR